MSSLDAASLFSVNGLVAVVTGGGTGIGLMIATALEHNGATVYILGRREEVLGTAARENAVSMNKWTRHHHYRAERFSTEIWQDDPHQSRRQRQVVSPIGGR